MNENTIGDIHSSIINGHRPELIKNQVQELGGLGEVIPNYILFLERVYVKSDSILFYVKELIKNTWQYK